MAPNPVRTLYGAYMYPALWATKHVQFGTNILDKEWDTLIVLDACRVDALREVADEYQFITGVDSLWSVGSTSKEWLLNTFTAEYKDTVREIGLVTGNAWVEVVLDETPDWGSWTALKGTYWDGNPMSKILKRDLIDADDFHTYLPVWENEGREVGNSAPRAEPITDTAIQVARERSPNKLLIHYMQPHSPNFHDTTPEESLSQRDKHPMQALRQGADRDEVWNAYLDNLRYVLNSVEVLLKNLDSEKVVITADHGELFGEFGRYGHVAAFPHPSLRKVPWVETTAEDHKSYSPDCDLDEMLKSDGDVEERLSALGYR